eukprot:2726454-Rhodomonas_salina.1
MICSDCCSIKVVDNGCVCNVGLEQYGTSRRGYQAQEVLSSTEQGKVFHNSAARSLDLWAVGVTCLQLACCEKHLTTELPEDGYGERTDRQDSMLSELLKEISGEPASAPQTLTLVQRLVMPKVVDNTAGMFQL